MQFCGDYLSVEGLEILVTEREEIVKTQIRRQAHLSDMKYGESSVEVLRLLLKPRQADQSPDEISLMGHQQPGCGGAKFSSRGKTGVGIKNARLAFIVDPVARTVIT